LESTLYKIRFALIATFVGISFFSCEKKSDSNYSIEGKIDNLPLQEIYALREATKDSLVIDTIPIRKEGEFKFEGKIDEPTMISLYIGEQSMPVNLFVQEGYHVKVKGDAIQSDLIEVKGGAVNDDINDFKIKNAGLLQSKHRILSKNENLDPAELKNINLQLARNVREYVEQNPAKIASVILMNEYSINNTSAEQLGKDIELLKGMASNFYLTTNLKSYYDKIRSSAKGAVAPQIEMKDIKNKTFKLTELKGKPVLLIFDLKNSPANTEYFDKLKESQKKLKNKVRFVSIILDENEKSPDPETVKLAKSLDWTVLLDGKKWNSKEVKKYNVTTAPYMILISENGLIKERDVLLDSLVVQYDKETKPGSKK